MMMKNIALHPRRYAKQFLSVEVITGIIVFVIGCSVGQTVAIAMGAR
jgi:hypothetical protein